MTTLQREAWLAGYWIARDALETEHGVTYWHPAGDHRNYEIQEA